MAIEKETKPANGDFLEIFQKNLKELESLKCRFEKTNRELSGIFSDLEVHLLNLHSDVAVNKDSSNRLNVEVCAARNIFTPCKFNISDSFHKLCNLYALLTGLSGFEGGAEELDSIRKKREEKKISMLG